MSSREADSNQGGLSNIPRGSVPKGLLWQRLVGRITFAPVFYLVILVIKFKFKLTVEDLPTIRRQFKEIAKLKRPLIICPNHLTMVDSVIIIWALAAVHSYFFNYRLFSWNIPAVEHYRNKPLWRFIAFVGKCIPIDRTGGNEHVEEVFEKIRLLLSATEVCMVFPEGTRSRTGRIDVDSTGYGIGKILRGVPDCQVLCVYLRGSGQKTYSTFPRIGERYHLSMELITPHSDQTGLRAVKDLSRQVILRLKEMEDRYFATINR